MGDELVSVNGRRLRGLSLSEARTCLRNTPREVEMVVARDTATPSQSEPAATPTAAPALTGMRKFSARRSSVAEVRGQPFMQIRSPIRNQPWWQNTISQKQIDFEKM